MDEYVQADTKSLALSHAFKRIAELESALRRLRDKRFDLCPSQVAHIVNKALLGEKE